MKSFEKLSLLFWFFLSKLVQLSITLRRSFVKYYENEGIDFQEHGIVVNILAFSIYYGARLFLWFMFFLFGCIIMNLITDKFNIHLTPFF